MQVFLEHIPGVLESEIVRILVAGHVLWFSPPASFFTWLSFLNLILILRKKSCVIDYDDNLQVFSFFSLNQVIFLFTPLINLTNGCLL